MWQAVTAVGTGIGLLALVAALIAYFMNANNKQKYAALEKLSSEDRLKAFRDIIGSISLEQEPSEIKHRIEAYKIKLDANDKLNKRRILFATICFIAFLATMIVVQLFGSDSQSTSNDTILKSDMRKSSAAPLARIDNFDGANLQWVNGEQYISQPTYFIKNPQNGDPETVYSGLKFDLSKISDSNAIRVDSMRLKLNPETRQLQKVFQTIVGNMKPPITYLAKLDGKPLVKCQLTTENKPTVGAIVFTEAEPTAKFLVNFEGKPGLYKVGIELDIVDVKSGNKQTLSSQYDVWINVPVDSE